VWHPFCSRALLKHFVHEHARKKNGCHAPLFRDYSITSKSTRASECDVALERYCTYQSYWLLYILLALSTQEKFTIPIMPITLLNGKSRTWESNNHMINEKRTLKFAFTFISSHNYGKTNTNLNTDIPWWLHVMGIYSLKIVLLSHAYNCNSQMYCSSWYQFWCDYQCGTLTHIISLLLIGIGSFVQNSLTDIITDMLLHATLPGYSDSINSHPYQFTGRSDKCLDSFSYILCKQWADMCS